MQDRLEPVDLGTTDVRALVDDQPAQQLTAGRGSTAVLRLLTRKPSEAAIAATASMSRDVPRPQPRPPEKARSSA